MVIKYFYIFIISTLITILQYAYCSNILYESRNSFCNIGGIDYPCTPPVTNIMKAAKVQVSSTCGETGSENICPHWKYNVPWTNFRCPVCSRDSFTSEYLTDSHNHLNQTCWFSGALYNQPDQNTVNITISFNKRFEIYYLSLQFCSDFPDSIVIQKSADYGVSWIPWHYFSKDCLQSFGLQPAPEYSYHDVDSRTLEPACSDLQKRLKESKFGNIDSILPFSPTTGRKLNESLIDWITVTDIRITLSAVISPVSSPYDYGKLYFVKHRRNKDILNMSSLSYSAQVSNNIYYGLSDVSVGGRCQCHGHSNKCIVKDNGRIRCDCEHNTDGVDCEKCKMGYHDTPWLRATRTSANSCKRCQCNLHSSHCQFNDSEYTLSGYKSGGVCYKCQHNTAGKECHYCEEGFYRDWSKPLSHDLACRKCKCHTIGSMNPNTCDKKSGQCFCKEGVTGRRCNQCKLGFRETTSGIRPCVNKYEIPSHPTRTNKYDTLINQLMANTESECKPCDEKRKRIRFKKFCRRNAVFLGTIESKEIHGKMVRFEIQVKEVWSISGKISLFISKEAADQYSIPLWISHEEVRCECPSIYLGRSYLVLMKFKTFIYRQREELLLDSSTVMLQWAPSWKMRLQKFKAKANDNQCQRHLLEKKKIKSK